MVIKYLLNDYFKSRTSTLLKYIGIHSIICGQRFISVA